MTKRAVGDTGEDIAAEFLERQGLTILDRNVVRHGVEADILAKQGKTWVIVEVKSKHGAAYGRPQEMVGPQKQRQLRRFAHSLLAEKGDVLLRIDVIAVDLSANPPHIEHLVNVVEEI